MLWRDASIRPSESSADGSERNASRQRTPLTGQLVTSRPLAPIGATGAQCCQTATAAGPKPSSFSRFAASSAATLYASQNVGTLKTASTR